MRKVLITGGAGFIGSNLCKKLVGKDVEVISIDNYSSGTVENHIQGVCYLNIDTSEITSLKINDFDVVYHLAEYSRVNSSFRNYSEVFKSNVLGTNRVIEFTSSIGAKLVYAGSSTSFSTDESVINASPYAWTKKNNAELIKNYANWFDLDYAICYFYNVYGDNEVESGEFATLIGLCKTFKTRNASFPVVSPGTQLRNFTHVNDVCEALISIGNIGKGDGYHIGSSNKYSILDVVNLFKLDYHFVPKRRGDRLDSSLDTTKISKDIGWHAKEDLVNYIIRFLEIELKKCSKRIE